MLFEPLEPNERFRARRDAARRRQRRRRSTAVALLLASLLGLAAGATVIGDDEHAVPAASTPVAKPKPRPTVPKPRTLPSEVRGVHVTMALASLEGKLEEYLDLTREGLNTIELDVKDENGEVGFTPSGVPLASRIGAAQTYYKPRQVVRKLVDRGVYLIGRIVVFEDPILAEKRPDLAIKRPDGSVWRNHAGLGWTNPYDRRVWDYNVDLAVAAARAGFDEIQFDYVRFPSDGDISAIVYDGKTATEPGWVIAQFVQYASKRLKPLGVRVSADVFGLSATRDLGIGQVPRRISRYLDAIYPMVYPSHYGPGEYNLPDPNGAPRETVAASLKDFRRELRGRRSVIIPWLQDFSYGRTYTLAEVQAQIDAASAANTGGFLLWNAAGIYSDGALTYRSPEG